MVGLYLYECNTLGTFNGETYGQVYTKDKKVDVQTFVSMVCSSIFVICFIGYAWSLREPWTDIEALHAIPSHPLLFERLHCAKQQRQHHICYQVKHIW